ncbi:uncharacterized protein LOC144106778 [Amblyomma americanum]
MNRPACFRNSSPVPSLACSAQRAAKKRCFLCSSVTRLILVLLVQTKSSLTAAPSLPTPPPAANDYRTLVSSEYSVTPVSSKCTPAGCASTDNTTALAEGATTSYAITTTQLDEVTGIHTTKVSTSAHAEGSATAGFDLSDKFLGASSSNPNKEDRPEVHQSRVPLSKGAGMNLVKTTASMMRSHTDPPTTEAPAAVTEKVPTTMQTPSSEVPRMAKPRRKLRKGQRRNNNGGGNGDRVRNASSSSSSSARVEEEGFPWEPLEPVAAMRYAFGLAFAVVALIGLVAAGMTFGGGAHARPLLGTTWATTVTALVVTSSASRSAALLLTPGAPWKRLLQTTAPASLFLALAFFWLALCRSCMVRPVVAGACFVALWAVPMAAESQAGGLLDSRSLLMARCSWLSAAGLGIAAAMMAYPLLLKGALKAQDAQLCSALAKMQDDAAEVPRRLPRPLVRDTLKIVMGTNLLCLVLGSLLAHGALHGGAVDHPLWQWWIMQGVALLAELCADFLLGLAASRPAADCVAPTVATATLLAVPDYATDAFGRTSGHRCGGGVGSRGDPGESAALCDSQSPAKTGLLGHATLQRTALLFHDQCVSSSVSTSRFCSAAGGSRDATSSDEDDDSHRALAGSTAPGTVEGSPWSQAHSSASFRRLGSSTCSSESAAHSFDLAWGGGGGGPLRPPQTLRLDLSHRGTTGGCGTDASQDVTPDSAVYVDLSPELRRSEGHSLDKLQNKNCPCCAARRPWRRAALQRYALSASRFSLSGYEPLRREDCRCCVAADHAMDPFRQMKSSCGASKEDWHRNLQSLPPPTSSAF